MITLFNKYNSSYSYRILKLKLYTKFILKIIKARCGVFKMWPQVPGTLLLKARVHTPIRLDMGKLVTIRPLASWVIIGYTTSSYFLDAYSGIRQV